MTDDTRKRRLDAAMAELEEFCGIFGFKCEWEGSDSRPELAMFRIMCSDLRHTVKLGSKGLYECARRDYRGSGYSRPYLIAERLLTRVKNGGVFSWEWEETKPAEHGYLTIKYVREYKIQKFSSVSELKLRLIAEGSEFAARMR